jgi:hypothetical protein
MIARRIGMVLLVIAHFSATTVSARPGRAYVRPMHFTPAIHAPYHPYWGCFGYCNGPLNPPHHHEYWGCFGYCNGPLPYHHWNYGGCYSPCPLPPIPPPIYACYGCVYPTPPIVEQPAVNVTYPTGDPNFPKFGEFPAYDSKQSIKEFGPTYQGKTLTDWIKMLKTGDAKARGAAAVAIGQIGKDAKAAIPALIAALKDTDPSVRMEATIALSKIGPEAITALTEALKSKNSYQRMGAALSLGHMGSAAKKAVAALQEALKDKSLAVRCHAAQALFRIDPEQAEAAVPVLAEGLKSDRQHIRMAAATTIGLIGPAAKSAAPALREARSRRTISICGSRQPWPCGASIQPSQKRSWRLSLAHSKTRISTFVARPRQHWGIWGPRPATPFPHLAKRCLARTQPSAISPPWRWARSARPPSRRSSTASRPTRPACAGIAPWPLARSGLTPRLPCPSSSPCWITRTPSTAPRRRRRWARSGRAPRRLCRR